MKKELLFIACALFLIVLIQAASAKVICSDNSSPETDIDEINVESSKRVNGLGIAVVETDQINVLKRITAKLLIDGEAVSVSNESSIDIKLLTDEYSISLSNVSESAAKITISGDTEEVTTEESETVKGLIVYLANTDISSNPTAKLMIGVKEISLSNDQNPTEEVKIGDQAFIIELSSASNSNAIIKVYKCETGTISEVAEQASVNNTGSNNQTANETIQNATANASRTLNETSTLQNQTNQTSHNNETSVPNEQKKSGFFRRIWNWFRGWFS